MQLRLQDSSVNSGMSESDIHCSVYIVTRYNGALYVLLGRHERLENLLLPPSVPVIGSDNNLLQAARRARQTEVPFEAIPPGRILAFEFDRSLKLPKGTAARQLHRPFHLCDVGINFNSHCSFELRLIELADVGHLSRLPRIGEKQGFQFYSLGHLIEAWRNAPDLEVLNYDPLYSEQFSTLSCFLQKTLGASSHAQIGR